MAFVLTPAYSHPYYSPSGFCSQAMRPAPRYRGMCSQSRRPQYSSFNHFFGQVDELLGEISHQAQRQAQLEAHRKLHQQRQLRKHALRAQFAVSQTEPGWQIEGEIQGFEQENLSIEVTNEYTLKVAGNTKWQSENALPQNGAVSSIEQVSEKDPVDKMDDSVVVKANDAHITSDSDVESVKSYQATVEDDFEDLGAETSSLISTDSEASTLSEAVEPKAKGKEAAEPNTPEDSVSSTPEKEEREEKERHHGFFERTFKFPERIDAANVRAAFKDGALTITVPKAPAQPPKTITIS